MRKPIAKNSIDAFIGGAETAVPAAATQVAPVKAKRERRYTQTSVSWTADYDTLIEDAIFEAMGHRIRANKSHVVRAAVRAFEKLSSAERIKLIEQVMAE